MGHGGPATPLLVFDLAGTFVFALSGAVAGVRRRLDLFGVFVLSFVAGIFGGIARDVLLARISTVLSADIYAVAAVVVPGQFLDVPATVATITGALLPYRHSTRLASSCGRPPAARGDIGVAFAVAQLVDEVLVWTSPDVYPK